MDTLFQPPAPVFDHNIDPNQVVPLYHQIYLILREQILEGRYASQPLPGELSLAEQFKVSRVTMRRALQDLVKEGLIARGRGKGTFAKCKKDEPPRVFGAQVSSSQARWLDPILDKADTTVHVLEMNRVLPGRDIADSLNLSAQDFAVKSVRVRHLKGEPLVHLTCHIPERFAQGFGRRDLQAKTVFCLMEEAGVQVHSARQSLSARLADAAVAMALDVPVGAPLLSVIRVLYDAHGQPLQHLRALFRPDRYDYRMVLTQQPQGDRRVWAHSECMDSVAQLT